MPQLWTETFVSQYFWLILILLTFNYFFVNKVVPSIAKNIKARRKTGIIKESEEERDSLNVKATLPEVTLTKGEKGARLGEIKGESDRL